ncbi:MAG: amidohydrolase, partial [Pseudomonadota bacterium]|nr:amidohydrolase [Pseudomonadota bacterium]
MLTNADIRELTSFRRELHRKPELSGEEAETAKTISGALTELAPDHLVSGLGGHGVAAVYDSGRDGPTVLFRAELDALPIEEASGAEWSSEISGKAHLCGHDGHMTMLLALARLLSRRRPQAGRCVLMFQPAEEDGSGARAVVADPKFGTIRPDWAFAIHNEPGLPFGYVGIRPGLINCASRGLAISLKGRTSHAAEPELASSPVVALPEMLSALDDLGGGGELGDTFRLSTITHINVGEATFGITPGDARIFVTLRASRDEAVTELQHTAETLISRLSDEHGLTCYFEVHDDFAASMNDPEAVIVACRAMQDLGIPFGEKGVPMRASEDFGAFGWGAKAAMLCLGPGEQHVALHQPEYDFPDDLIPVGARIFDRILRDL